MENPYLAMLWSALNGALPYLLPLAVLAIALKWLEAQFAPKRRGRSGGAIAGAGSRAGQRFFCLIVCRTRQTSFGR